MRYVSTRGKGQPVDFTTAMLTGLAIGILVHGQHTALKQYFAAKELRQSKQNFPDRQRIVGDGRLAIFEVSTGESTSRPCGQTFTVLLPRFR